MSLLGASFLLASLVLTKEKHFPGWWALLPVIGASLILAAGAQAWFNRVFLSAPVVVWFGIISFPLYLWHWPLLSFARIMAGDTPPAAVRYGVIVASVLLAWATHKLVEHPLRFGARRKRNTTILLAGMTLTGVAGYGVHLADGLPARLNEFQRRQTHETLTQMQMANYEGSDIFRSAWRDARPIKARDFLLSSRVGVHGEGIAVIGDSHANRLYLGLTLESRLSWMNIGRGSCPPLMGVDVLDKENASLACQPLVDNYLAFIRNSADIGVVIIHWFNAQYGRDVPLVARGDPVRQRDAMVDTIRYLASAGKTVVVVMDVPEVPTSCYPAARQRAFPVWNSDEGRQCLVDRASRGTVRSEIDVIVAEVGEVPGRVLVFDPADVLCRVDVCGEVDAANYLYQADGNHLNEFGARLVGRWLLGRLRDANVIEGQ